MPVDRCENGMAWREAAASTPQGHAEREPIVLLHGLGGSRISWEPQLAALGEHRRTVAWDLPGYGAAPPLDGPFTFPALADAVARLADALGADRVHLAGISFGGMIAQYAAALHADRVATLALLATSPAFGLDGTRPDVWRAARLAPLDAGLEPADIADRVLGALAGPSITPAAMAGQRDAKWRISGGALRRSVDCLVTHDSRSLLGRITAPTMCLVGDLDDETPVGYSEALVAAIPGARLVVVAGAGHLLNAEAPDVVNKHLLHHVVSHSAQAGVAAP